MSAMASATCRICREVKPGRLAELPNGVVPVAEPMDGGFALRPGKGPVPFVCTHCEERQRKGEIGLLPGQVVEVEHDDTWRPGLFVRVGDPAEAEVVQDERVEGGEYRRDVAFVRDASGHDDQSVPHARIRLPR